MTDFRSKKLTLFYFVAFSVVVVLIFAVSISSYYIDFYGKLSTIKSVLKGSAATTQSAEPTVTPRDPSSGAADASVTLIEYADITCPACADADAAIDAVRSYYGDRVRVIFKGVTITGHPERKRALTAAYCAGAQGKFWDYKAQLFANQGTLGTPLYTQIAGDLGMNAATFGSCLDGTAYEGYISDTVAEALRVGLTSTPTIYLNGTRLSGPYSFASLQSTIDAAITR